VSSVPSLTRSTTSPKSSASSSISSTSWAKLDAHRHDEKAPADGYYLQKTLLLPSSEC
jgi:hypothetical protein